MAWDGQRNWMWSEALDVLARAERLHRNALQFRPAISGPAWEPPADVLETDEEVLIFVAVPGVAPDDVKATIDDGCLIIAGKRSLPPRLRNAAIHRLELPQGNFERRIPLPRGRYTAVGRSASDGCLLFTLRKAI